MFDTIQPMRPLTAAQIQHNLLAALILRGIADTSDDTTTEEDSA